ncbi:MAG TPA: DUF3463 domain-containing protein, partial [Ktedonobacterales bacterium]|nr:DUF3463 domain-containing protein [Ktedonobacterales bacterium]
STPTYTVAGWRSPCYLLADKHTASFKELLDTTDWEKYGTGRDPRCAIPRRWRRWSRVWRPSNHVEELHDYGGGRA